jgi:large subunit ribosomal protein L23
VGTGRGGSDEGRLGMNAFEVIIRPLVTEKSTFLQEQGKYVFEVNEKATRSQVRDAVQQAFKVTVTNVNIVNLPGKMKRFGMRISLTPGKKKAVVTLKQGDKITIFEGV